MKKVMTLILVLVFCLSLCACGKSDACTCDCAQCADCEKKTQITDATNADDASGAAEQNDNVIEFESPIVVAENEYVRIEVTRFYQEYRSWNGSYPNNADSTVEDATLEKFLVFKYCNKSDQALVVQMDDMYLGSDGASYYSISSPSVEIAEGKNNLGTFLVRTGEKETLKSMEELYFLDGQFYVWSRGEDGVLRNQHNLEFSIPNGMNAGSGTSDSEATPLEQASSDQRVGEVIELINEIVLEDIAVTDTVKETLNGIYAKYNALTDEEREKVSNYETLSKAKDTYNEMWVKSLITIEKAPLYKNNYTSELELDIIWVNNSPKTIKYIYFTAGIKNSVGDYFTKDGQKFAIYQQIGPFKTNYRKPNDGAYWPTGLYPNKDEVGGAVINEVEIIYMDGSSATITENEIRFAFPK